MTDGRAQAIEAARALEKGGQIDTAVRAYLRAGAIEEAARALAAVKRYADAGHLVMESLGVGPALVGGLDPDRKRLAMKAAVCFAQAGESRKAVELFLALGDALRAAEVMERAGDPAEAARIRGRIEKKSGGGATGSEIAGAAGRAGGMRLEAGGQYEAAMQQYIGLKAFADAARMAYKLRKFVDAAQFFEDAGMAFEAAACFAEAGETGRCLETVVRVQRDHPKYRVAAAQAIRLASDLNVLDFKLDTFLGPFIADAPKDERELEALYALGKLYRLHDHVENAREVLRKVVAVNPRFREAAAMLAQLDEDSKGSRMAYERIVRDDAAFKGDARLRAAGKAPPPPPSSGRMPIAKSEDEFFPDLPDLPPPPVAPPKPQKTAYIAPMSGQMTAVRPSGQIPAVRTPTSRSDSTLQAVKRSPATAPSASMPGELAVGAIVAERYRIEAKIGQGGMAAVYRAHDLELGEDIAMKLFLQPSDDPQLLARFKQELTLSRGLSHPNIVRLYDIGQHQGCRFLTMELLHGTDLGAIIDGKALELTRGLKYMIQACAGLAVAHDKGVIHRDIKPANFFVTSEDVLKVMDFGIAKKSEGKQNMTQAGFIAGTPAYMSPEQINNFSAVSHRTDLYALGIVAYEAFTGAVPFDDPEMMKLLMMHLTVKPPSPRSKNPAIPEELDAIILKLLEKDPAQRIQSCKELGDELQKLLP